MEIDLIRVPWYALKNKHSKAWWAPIWIRLFYKKFDCRGDRGMTLAEWKAQTKLTPPG
jgi:hypothetical protein